MISSSCRFTIRTRTTVAGRDSYPSAGHGHLSQPVLRAHGGEPGRPDLLRNRAQLGTFEQPAQHDGQLGGGHGRADAAVRAAAERDELVRPDLAVLRLAGQPALRAERERLVVDRRAAMGHVRAEQQRRPRGHGMAGELEVRARRTAPTRRPAGTAAGSRTRTPRRYASSAAARRAASGWVTQQVDRPGHGRAGGLVAGRDQRDGLVADLLVGQPSAVLVAAVDEQREHPVVGPRPPCAPGRSPRGSARRPVRGPASPCATRESRVCDAAGSRRASGRRGRAVPAGACRGSRRPPRAGRRTASAACCAGSRHGTPGRRRPRRRGASGRWPRPRCAS